MSRLIQVVYVSDQTKSGSPDQTPDLFDNINDDNPRNGITGFLYALGGCFVSVLEGEHDTIISRMERLAADTRHQRMIVLREGAINERRFLSWNSNVLDAGEEGEMQRADAQAFASRLSKGLRMATARAV